MKGGRGKLRVQGPLENLQRLEVKTQSLHLDEHNGMSKATVSPCHFPQFLRNAAPICIAALATGILTEQKGTVTSCSHVLHHIQESQHNFWIYQRNILSIFVFLFFFFHLNVFILYLQEENKKQEKSTRCSIIQRTLTKHLKMCILKIHHKRIKIICEINYRNFLSFTESPSNLLLLQRDLKSRWSITDP